VEKKIARLPCAHKEVHYRCFLPDLTGFVILYCTGPGYHTDDHLALEKRCLRGDFYAAIVTGKTLKTYVSKVSSPLFVRRLYSPLRGASRRFVERPVPFVLMQSSQATAVEVCVAERNGQRILIRARKKTPSSSANGEKEFNLMTENLKTLAGVSRAGGDYSSRFLPRMETSSSAARVGATLPSSTSCRTLGSSFLISSCW